MNEKKPGFRNVVALGLVSFFTDVSTEMVLGLLPVFILKELRASYAILGLIEGVAEFLSYTLRLISGLISDIFRKRKLLVLIGYAISNFAKPLFALAKTWTDVFAVRVVDRIGKGVRTAPRDALLSVSVESRDYGKAFGLHRTLDQLGAILGPTLAVVFIPYVGFRGVFLLSFIPGLLALIVLALMVQEVPVKRERRSFLEGASRALTRKYIYLLAVVALFHIGAYNFSFVLARAEVCGIPAYLVPLVYALINVTHTVMGIPAGFLSDRIGGGKVLALGYFLFSLVSLAFSQRISLPIAALLIALLFGVYQGIAETVQRALVPQCVPSELKGTAFGVYYLVIGISFLAGNTIVGYLWTALGYTVAFTFSAMVTLIASILALILLR